MRLVTHLLFANDILIFVRANRKSLTTVNHLVDEFSIFSGLWVNVNTSSIDLLKACEAKHDMLVGILGYVEERLPIKYLGVRLVGCDFCCNDCHALIQQVIYRFI